MWLGDARARVPILNTTCLSLCALLPLDTSPLSPSLVERCGERKGDTGTQSWCAMHSWCRVLVSCICPPLVEVTQNAIQCSNAPRAGVDVRAFVFVCECVGACVRRLKVLQGLVQNERRRLEAKKTLKSLFLSD